MKDEFGFTPNYASAQEHVPQAEWNNRVIKEHLCAAYHYGPYKMLPHKVLKVLVMECRKFQILQSQGNHAPYLSELQISMFG